jgi:hypothetical protein
MQQNADRSAVLDGLGPCVLVFRRIVEILHTLLGGGNPGVSAFLEAARHAVQPGK